MAKITKTELEAQLDKKQQRIDDLVDHSMRQDEFLQERINYGIQTTRLLREAEGEIVSANEDFDILFEVTESALTDLEAAQGIVDAQDAQMHFLVTQLAAIANYRGPNPEIPRQLATIVLEDKTLRANSVAIIPADQVRNGAAA